MFYFFFESRNKKDDPLVIWLTGGPGCSSELAMFYENGPFKITNNMSLAWNEYGWDKVFIILDYRILNALNFCTGELIENCSCRFPIFYMLISLLELVSATPQTKVIFVMTKMELAMIYMIFSRFWSLDLSLEFLFLLQFSAFELWLG